jgi:cytochrome P450 family 709
MVREASSSSYLLWFSSNSAPTAGRTFLYWFGARPTLCVADVNMVQQVLSDRNGLYPKNTVIPHIARLLGNGLVLTNGDEWKRHRKVVHPAFDMDKLKVRTMYYPSVPKCKSF